MEITEIFESLQGEGVQMGQPTIFIRLTGCNLRCEWCDTQYAYDNGTEMSIPEIIEEINKFPGKLICITGGEPLTQPETGELVDELLNLNYSINLETNGSINIDSTLNNHDKILISMDVKCPSSQMESKMDLTNIQYLKSTDQLKFIIKDQNDYEFAFKILQENRSNCNIIFTPVNGIDLKWLAEKVIEDHTVFSELGLNVRVLPQLHKLVWGNAKGR